MSLEFGPTKGHTLLSPGVVTTHETGELTISEIYGFGQGTDGALHTVEYHQGGRDRAKIVSADPVRWDVKVPAGAHLFSVTSGVSAGRANQFWVGWVTGEGFHAQALTAESIHTSRRESGEVPIYPAVMDEDGAASLYSWRPAEGGLSLGRHEFTARGATASRNLLKHTCAPVVSVAATIPGEESRHAVVGWIEPGPGGTGAVLGLAVISERSPRVLMSPPIPDVVPFARQRLGLWAGSFKRIEFSAVVARKEPRPSYSLVRFSVDPSSPAGKVVTTKTELPPGFLQSAAIEYYKDHSRPRSVPTFLTSEGRLLKGQDLDERRRGVPLDSVLPVVTTAAGAYWGERGADGALAFTPL